MEYLTEKDLEFRYAKNWSLAVIIMSVIGSLFGLIMLVVYLNIDEYLNVAFVIAGFVNLFLYIKTHRQLQDFEKPSLVPYYFSMASFLLQFMIGAVRTAMSDVVYYHRGSANIQSTGLEGILIILGIMVFLVMIAPAVVYVIAFFKVRKVHRYFDEEGDLMNDEELIEGTTNKLVTDKEIIEETINKSVTDGEPIEDTANELITDEEPVENTPQELINDKEIVKDTMNK